MKNVILFSGIITLFPVIVFSQSATQNILPKISPASPEQATFAKFGNYEVNLFHGLPDITIPLYEIKSGSLTLPISISYHASGIKVNDWGSWVGIGWTLNAGASITRKIMGLPDEKPGNYLSGVTVRDESTIHTNIQADLDYLKDINAGFKDAEPDIFYYNMPGKTGKFLFNQQDNFKPIVIPFDPIKINMSGPEDFKITDDDGTLYDFHDIETTNITTTSTSAWLISQISSSNNQDHINFTYTSRWGQVGADYQDYVIDDQNVVNKDLNGPVHYSSTFTTLPQKSDLIIFSDEQKINEITFTNGKVVFFPSVSDRQDGFTGQKSLDHIEIYNQDPVTGTYNLIKTIHFYQSYFTNGVTGSDWYNKRLKLDRVEITDKNGNVIEKYQFDYNTDITMPDKLSRAKDYWGYYNAKPNNTLVPQQTVPFYDGTTSTTHTIGSGEPNGREASPVYMKACMLKRIYYPTGGYTDFEFETNQYQDENNITKYAGGLRIKTIKSYDGINSHPLTKTYIYGDGENGFGRANFFNPLQYLAIHQQYRYIDFYHNAYGDAIAGCVFDVSTKSRTTNYATPTIEIEPYDGSPVVYKTVTEYIGDGINNTGKTIYEFTDHADDIYSNRPTVICQKPIVTSYHMDRGQLLHKTVYKKNETNAYIPVSETLNMYQDFSEQWFNKIGLVVMKNTISENGTGSDLSFNVGDACISDANSYSYANYNIRSTYNRLTQSTEIVYDENDLTKKVTTTSNYSYENPAHMQPTKIVTTNSKGETITSARKYPPDIASEPYVTMTGLNILDKVIQEKNSNNTAQISLVKSNYTDQGNSNYLPSTIDYQLGTNPSETRAVFNNYDAKGNILDMQKTNDVKAAFQWGYNKVYPVAEVKNATNDLKETVITGQTTSSLSNTLISTTTANSNGQFTASYTAAVQVSAAGNIVVKLGTTGGTHHIYGSIIGIGTPVNIDITPGLGCEAGFIYTYSNMQPMTYNITISLWSSYTFGACAKIEYPTIYTYTESTGSKEFFYNGFEEDGTAATATPCAGKRYHLGDYQVPFTQVNSKAYYVSYHYLLNGNWIPITKTYTTDNMVLSEGDAIDEVRVFPKDAQMVTYTYEPLIGMTSKCDINNHISFYNYDNYGRLRTVKDEDGNILKLLSYKYTLTSESATVTDCSPGNCTGTDANGNPNKQCINGSCELGKRVNTSTTLRANGTWKCSYHYEYSNGARTPATGNYTEFNAAPCDL